MLAIVGANGNAHVPSDRWILACKFAILLISSLLLLTYDASDGDNFNGDIDDLLRSIQIRALVEHGRWYDLSLSGLTTPEPYISAWSRLVDLPYLLISKSLSPLIGEEPALRWAYNAWPPALLAGVVWLYAWVQIRMAPNLSSWAGVLSIMLGAFAIFEFAPGRIDHHNVQMLLLMAVLTGLTLQLLQGGAIAGVAGVLSVATGLETIPLLGAAYGLAVAQWLLRADGAREALLGLGLASALATPIAVVLLIEPDAFILQRSDSLSAPYIYALVGFGLIAAACCSARISDRPIAVRLLAILVPGLLLLAGLVHFFPTVVSGPFQMIDPHLKEVWLERIQQERNILSIFQAPNVLLIGFSAGFFVVIALVVARVADDVRNGREIPWAAVVMAAASFLCMLYAVRFLRFAALFVSLVLPYAILWLQERTSRRRLFAPATFAVVLSPVIIVLLMMKWIAPVKRPADTASHVLSDGCEAADFTVFQRFPPGRILAGPALGIRIAYHAPPGFAVSSVPFQRAASSIRRTLDIFVSPAAKMAPVQRLAYDYVAICTPKAAITPADDSFYQVLVTSGRIAGLQPLTDGRLRIYRIAR